MPALFKRSGGIYYVQFISLSTSFSSSHLQASLGAVDYERGYAVKVYGSGRAGREGFFPRLVLTGDVGWALSIDHSSVWLRGAAGTGFGRTGMYWGISIFGGFGNNWVDYREIKRYREMDAFRALPSTVQGADCSCAE